MEKTSLSASERENCLNDSFALQCSDPAKPTDCSHDSASDGPNPPRLFRFREIDIPEVQKELELNSDLEVTRLGEITEHCSQKVF